MNKKNLRIFFFPVFATGHIIPMANLAAMVALRPGMEPTIVTTPANAAIVSPTIDRSIACGNPIKLLTYPFPSEEVGLPPGQENIASMTDSVDTVNMKVGMAIKLCRGRLDSLLRHHRPDVVVAEAFYLTVGTIASELGIPLISFQAIGVFSQMLIIALHSLDYDTDEVVTVPDFSEPEINIPRSELPEFLQPATDTRRRFWDMVYAQQKQSYGVVVNTLYELEPAYCDRYRKSYCQRAWFVPLLTPPNSKTGDDDTAMMEWLDGQREGSVVFVSLGSWCDFNEEQLGEMALGLESSGAAFLWTVRASVEWEAPEGWEERVRGRGRVVRGWAPQVAILGHAAVGAFLTHCGWNAVLEAAVAGVPVLTWPMAVEQFLNERVPVDFAGMGERAVPDGPRSTREEGKVVVPREVIAKAVSQFMENGRVREQARKYAEMAKAAMEEGGSAYNDLNHMIDQIIDLANGPSQEEKKGTSY